VLACAATYPLDLVRTRLATQTTTLRYAGVLHCLTSIHGAEGARGLYRGLGATLAGVAPSLAMNFAVYETLRAKISASAPPSAAPALALVAGSASGAVSAIVCFPLDLVRRRMQLLPEVPPVTPQDGASCGASASTAAPPPPPPPCRPRAPSMASVARTVMLRDGVRGFYRGIAPELAKVVPGVGIAFGTYEWAKQKLGVDA